MATNKKVNKTQIYAIFCFLIFFLIYPLKKKKKKVEGMNGPQMFHSFPVLTILVPSWFVQICLLFFYLGNLSFKVFTDSVNKSLTFE